MNITSNNKQQTLFANNPHFRATRTFISDRDDSKENSLDVLNWLASCKDIFSRRFRQTLRFKRLRTAC